ncbi:MAG: YdcF family protein [Pseudomonadota bacterium]
MNPDTLRTINEVLLPPSGLVLLLAVGLFFWLIRLRKTAALFIFLATILLYFASSPFVSRALIDTLQYQHDVLKEVPEDVQAIVVLSGGREPIAREYRNLDTVNSSSLERLRYASRLAKVHSLPIVLVGGSVHGERKSEASLMQQALKTDFGVEASLLEEESKNTFENARFVNKVLKDNSISKVLLVTHAYHMPRAMWCFKDVGLEPIAAPTIFYKRNTVEPELQDYIPRARALTKTRIALHEHFGLLWYKFVGY